MEYKSEYMAEYYASNEPNEYVITQEVIILRSYTVEASSLSNAVEQIESEDYTGVISEDDSVAEVKKGRVVSARVNDDE